VSAGKHAVQAPRAGDSLELTLSALLEGDARPCDEIAHRARRENLSGCRLGRRASADVDGDAGGLTVVYLAFAGVDARE
jgi:hypothetical protein